MAQIDSLEVRIEASAAKASNAIHALQANLRSLRGTLESTISILGKDVFKDLIQNADKVETSMRKVSKAAKEIDFSKIAAPSFSGMSLPKVQKFLEDQEKALQKFRDKAAKDEAIGGKVPIGTQYDIEKAKVNVAAAKEEIAARQEAMQLAFQAQEAKRLEQEEAKRLAEQAEREANALKEAAGTSLTLKQELEQAAEAQRKTAEAIDNYGKSGGASPIPIDERIKAAQDSVKNMGKIDSDTYATAKAAVERYGKAIEQTANKIDLMQVKSGQMSNPQIDAEQSKLDNLRVAYEQALAVMQRYEAQNPPSMFARIRAAVNTAATALSDFKERLSAIWNVMQRLISPIASVVSHTWKLVSALNGAHKSSEKSGSSFKKLAKFLIRYGFGMRSFFFLFRRLRKGMKEGFEHLGTYSSEAQQAIYGLKASVETLKNAFAAGFSNLLGPVTNFLQGVINAIASALNAIGRFIAALGGKGFAIQAIKVSADEMKALDKNTGGAASSAKKLDKALSVLPFDELNQLNGDKNSGGSGGGGGGSSANSLSASQMFETVALDGEEYIQQLGQRIRDAFLSKDWQTLGEVLADPINKFVDNLYDKLNWEKNKPKIKAFTDGVTQTFNSLVKNVNWSKIGLTISSAINDITTAITGLVDGTDWGTLGSSIGTAFNTLLNNTDWAALGKMIFSRIKIVLETAAGFIETTDWSAVGTAFGNFILGALENINLPKIGTTLANLLNGAMEAAIALLQSGAVGKIVSDLGDMLVNFATNVDWENVGYTIGKALASIDWGKALADVATAAWTAFTGLLKGLIGSGGMGVAAILGGGYLGSKVLKDILGGGAAGGGHSLATTLASVLATAIKAHPVVAALTAVIGGVLLFYNPNGAKEFAERTDFEGYGLSEAELKALEQQGYSRATIAAQLKKGYGVDNYKKIAAEQISVNKKYAKLSVNAFATQFNKSLKTFTNQRDMQKQMNIMMDETVGITGIGGQNAVNEYIAGMDKGKETNKSRLTSLMNNILSAFNISGKIKTDGANATTSWFTGANEKYNQTVSDQLKKLTDKFAGKYNKDSTIKGYGASGAQAYVDGVNGYKLPGNAFSKLFSDIKLNMLSADAKKTLTDAGQSLAGWVVGGFKSVAFPPLSISVSSSQLGTDAERAEQLSRRNAGRATSIISNAVKIGWFGKGGLFDSSTIIGYGVGEAGKEAIIPLENRRTMGMIADSILGGYGTQGIADQIVRGVTEAMMMASRSQQINVNATLYTEDNEVLARAVNKGNRAITYRESALAYSGV